MIARLTGTLASWTQDAAVIDVNGVGYLCAASTRTLAGLGQIGDSVTLHIETHVREDAIQLFGFTSENERDHFRLLQTVQGVGARVALAILSAMTSQDLASAIAAGDAKSFARANGVGPKLAARIVNELADKPFHVDDGDGGDTSRTTGVDGHGAMGRVNADALSALTNLGFRADEASRAIAAARAEGMSETGDLVRAALKRMAR